MPILAIFVQAAVASSLAHTPSTVQQTSSQPMIQALERCLSIAADAERLTCMDRAARTLIDATRTREVMIVDREEMKKTRKSLFGFTLPRINLFGGRDGPDGDREDVQEIETVIKQIGTSGYDRYVLTTEDGARWTTTEGWSGQVQPKIGRKVRIKKGMMGGFSLTVEGGRAIRAMRTG